MKFTTAINAGVVSALFNAAQTTAQTPEGFSPSSDQPMAVKFRNNMTIPAGGSVPLGATTFSPAVTFPRDDAAADESHVLLMVDLDAPGGASDNSYSPLLHWLIPIPGDEELAGLPYNETTTPSVAPYAGPAPSAGDGPHRYVVLLFSNPKPTFSMPPSFSNLTFATINDRLKFDVEKFAEEADLSAVAASWFTTEKPGNGTAGTKPPVSSAPARTTTMMASGAVAAGIWAVVSLTSAALGF